MSDEPTIKQRRLDDDDNSTKDGQSENVHFSPTGEMQAGTDCGFEDLDRFLSSATASSWPFDEFAHDLDYLAYLCIDTDPNTHLKNEIWVDAHEL